MEVRPLGSGENSPLCPLIPLRPPILGSVIRIPSAEFRTESPGLIKPATSRAPMGYGRGAQPNHKEWAVNSIRVDIGLLALIISDWVQYGAILGGISLFRSQKQISGRGGRSKPEISPSRSADFPVSIPKFPICNAGRRLAGKRSGKRAANRRRSCDPAGNPRANYHT